MSNGGLAKLTEYLNQTRRQAENSIDILNTRIKELTDENEKLSSDREHYRQLSEQMKLENSKKWKLQERDDWKSLVDSVQKDRSRLQEECARLEAQLEQSNAEVKVLEDEIGVMHEMYGTNHPSTNASDPAAAGANGDVRESDSHETDGTHMHSCTATATATTAQMSGRFGLNGNGLSVAIPDAVAFFSTPAPGRITPTATSPPSRPSRKSFDGTSGSSTAGTAAAAIGGGGAGGAAGGSSPRAREVSARLQVDLQRALTQLDLERRSHEAESLVLHAEIRRLEMDLERVTAMLPKSVRQFITNGQTIPPSHRTTLAHHSPTYRHHNSRPSWYAAVNPMNIFSFLFSSNSHHSSKEDPDGVILNV